MCLRPSAYCPGMVRVSWVSKAGWCGLHIPVLSWDSPSILEVMARYGTTLVLSEEFLSHLMASLDIPLGSIGILQ